MFLSRGDRDLGVAFQTHLVSQALSRGEAKGNQSLKCVFFFPSQFCSFGSRLMGRGYYVFDRRWDRFRFALNSMVEKHLNSQMWK